ncbi:MAG: heterocyst development glycosyltransferase HepC [Cyanobacteria bacterium J06597_16]
MIASTALLKTPRILSLTQPDSDSLAPAMLLWRRNFLLIKAATNALPNTTSNNDAVQMLPALQNRQWFEECLRHSPVKALRLDMALGETTLRGWANVCDRTKKRVFVHLPAATHLPKHSTPLLWRFKRFADWVVAAGLTVGLSPLFILVAVLVRLDSPGSIFFRQWRVGHRGQLFQILKFRTMQPGSELRHHQVMGQQSGIHKLKKDPRVTGIGQILRKYSLDELPQLLNVLRGEMSLVGPRPWALYDAVRLEPAFRRRLNALPGLTGAWQVTARSHDCDLASVSRIDLDYLQHWRVQTDLKFLLLTLPKVVSGFGAY